MSNIVHGRQNTELYRLLYTKSEGFIGRFQNPINTIILRGKQCVELRGYREDIHDSSNNCGNFLRTLKLLSETNSDLKHQLEAPSAGNAM